MRKKFVYICSPFKGNRIENINKAIKRSRYAFAKGFIPVCVHCFLETVTGLDEDYGDRKELLEIGKSFVSKCDEVWVFCNPNISEGMQSEIDYAKKNKIKIRRIVLDDVRKEL